jgi:dienelactone hydrolase
LIDLTLYNSVFIQCSIKRLLSKMVNKHHTKYYSVLKIIFIALAILFKNTRLDAQDDLNIINKWLQFSDASNSLYHYLSGEAYQLLNYRTQKIAQLHSLQEWKERQVTVQKTIWNTLGPFPEKTPLNARITGTIEKEGYRIENVIYESLPGFYVTASLFIPKNVKKPAPAILFCSGHSTGVYRLAAYQLPLLNLVKKGFIVLAIDPIGQGERLQYYNKDTGASTIGSSTLEHSFASVQVSLIGKSIARYFIWDGIRGIDYLENRKEVDSKRIGVQGLSGGGTQTAFISALDQRVVAAAPSNYITSFKRLLESIGLQDGEQNFYHGILSGIDHPDFLEVRAPKPTLIMATTNDFFSIQGARETYAEAKRAYGIFGKPDNINITEDDFGHGYTKKNREAMYAFFQKYLQLPGSPVEEKVDFATAHELQKTSTGQLSTSLGGETVFSLNRKEAEKMIDKLQTARKNFPRYLPGILNSAKKLSGYHEPSVFHETLFTGRVQREGYVIEKYFVKGEGDYIIPYLLMIPQISNNKALIYLHPSGKSTEASVGGEMEWFVKKGFTLLAPDLIGLGEMGSGKFHINNYTSGSGMPYSVWFESMLIGRSIVGIQAGDIIRLARLLKKNAVIKQVYGLAIKEMGPVLLHAAAFDTVFSRIALIGSFSSYRSIVMNRFYNPEFIYSIVPGALKAYDLPDLAASLAPKKLIMAGVTDGLGNSTDTEDINKDLGIIKFAYQNKKAGQQLNIVPLKPTEKPYDIFMELIK